MLLERTLADCERVLGSDHPGTLASRNNLALAYVAAGRAAEAIVLLERTLADRERVLGSDHPGTLASGTTLPPPGRHWADGCLFRIGSQERGAWCACT